MKGHVTIYVEGASKGELVIACRKAFRLFFERAGLKGRMPKVLPCGPRGEAYRNFCMAMKSPEPDEQYLLLVDSEGPISSTPWQHVLQRVGDGWAQPSGASDDHLHFMVQAMESWFLADTGELKKYFGPKFQEKKLPKNTNLEAVTKDEIAKSLKSAVQDCPSATYQKGRDSFEILSKIDPHLVAGASPHANRFLNQLKLLIDAGSQG